jgi:membrane fusion protein (multidrug efflux system)
MSFKKPYLAIAIIGVVAASGAAWWLQNKPASSSAELLVKAGNTPNSPTQAAGSGAPATSAPGPGGPGGPGGPPRPAAVEVAKVESALLVDETQSVGSLRSFQGVMLRPEVGGRVSQVLFKDGQKVKKGQVLVQFDDQLPAAQVAQAKAELSIAQANHTRNQELVAQN